MKKDYKIFLIFGIIIFILPFLGVPSLWKTVIQFMSGLVLIISSLIYKSIENDSGEEPTFEESNGEEYKEEAPVQEETVSDYGDEDEVVSSTEELEKINKEDEVKEDEVIDEEQVV